MADTIRLLTPEVLQSQAREAAERGVPLDQANHHEHGTTLWRAFNDAYMEVAAKIEGERVEQAMAAGQREEAYIHMRGMYALAEARRAARSAAWEESH